MKTASFRVRGFVLVWAVASVGSAGTFSPLDWQTRVSVVPEAVSSEGPFEVAIGFDRCFERDELESLGDNLVYRSDLVSAAIFRFNTGAEFRAEIDPFLFAREGAGDMPRATVFQFEPMRLSHGTSVRGHEARQSDYYPGPHPHDQLIRGANVGIAVIDSGVDAVHIQLDDTGDGNSRWVAGFDALLYDPRVTNRAEVPDRDVPKMDAETDPKPKIPHGTAVAGIALGKDLAGGYYLCRSYSCGAMAPEARLIDVKVTDSTEIRVADVMEALDWLAWRYESFDVGGVVANLSFSSCEDDPDGELPPAKQANVLVDLGIPVVAAHGNASSCGFPSRCDAQCNPLTGSPGSARYAITVAGTDDRGKVDREFHRPFCDGLCGLPRTEKPDLSASAELVMTPSLADGALDLYARRSGTSVAAAHVSGAVALIQNVRPTMPPASIKKALIDSGDRRHNPGQMHWDEELGWGILTLNWLTKLKTTPPEALADLTFEGCKAEKEDGPLSDCEIKDASVPWWRNDTAIVIGEPDGRGDREVDVNVVNYGSMSVSALVRLEGYDRVIGNRHYYHLEDKTVHLAGYEKKTLTFNLTGPKANLKHFRAEVHSAWDRSYKNNRTRFNLDDHGDRANAEFLLDSPFLEPARLTLSTRLGCRILDAKGEDHRSIVMYPATCPETWTLRSSDGEPCDLTVSGGPISQPDRSTDPLGGIRLVPAADQ